MTKRAISTLCIGLIFLGLAVSLCLGVEEYLPQLTDVRDLTDTSDNKQNLRLMQAIQQYASKFNNQNLPVEDEEEIGTKRKRSVNQDVTKSALLQKRETGEDTFGEFADYATGKRGLSLQKNPLDMGFKNRPGFRSWGGKRSKFVTWGGKRFAPEVYRSRKSKFNNWGGKRNVIVEDDLERWDEKRDTFRSWGGKRGVIVPPTLRTVYDSHSKFSNWGGKRSDNDDHRNEKRDLEYTMPYEQYDGSELEGKRGEFQSWGGKRLDRIGDGFIRENIIGMNWLLRRYFNTLVNQLQSQRRVGKKNILGMRPLEEDDRDFSTSGFSAWRGRR